MSEKELREAIGIKPNVLINTNLGHMDILSVEDDVVHLGFLATGRQQSMSVTDFIKRMKG